MQTWTGGVIEEKHAIQTGQMGYDNEKIPEAVKNKLNHNNNIQANAKIVGGSAKVLAFNLKTGIVLGSAIVPLGEEVEAAEIVGRELEAETKVLFRSAEELLNSSKSTEIQAVKSSIKTNVYLSKSTEELLKTKSSFENLITEHLQKLREFLKDPIANSSPAKIAQMTADNPSEEVLLKRALGRAEDLEKQIAKQEKELEKVNSAIQQKQKP
ncbi:hypothetical protein [Mucilaginibacter gotjawali]|uniref:Uncharacterized protein n=2 Tax=Mucilaginibacter gotjawali TaxID=1550579 RepID=A0A839S8I9_9SPHI|nr:hypothetical protein [Mucilaginibacter gotjawali]MBB3053948.1 hypothetical protein [Mucilaginibacter gotjawali]